MQFLDGRVTVHGGDCLDVLDTLEPDSCDACVCDPPYHLTSITKRFGAANAAPAQFGTDGAFARASKGFMSTTWDGGDIAFQPETWAKVLRVLKPGAYIVAFSSSRTFGRMSVAIEDAGFITHPFVAWIFGQGFPKATRIKAEGYEGWRYGAQALKPAMEPIYMGQKPFEKGLSGTKNIIKHGTGGLNIDGCRVKADDKAKGGAGVLWSHIRDNKEPSASRRYTEQGSTNFAATPGPRGGSPQGRWPANLLHDGSDEVLAVFPETKSGKRVAGEYGGMGYHGSGQWPMPAVDGNSGSAARFFYSSKANADDRLGSKHPTVKPIDLMQYLIRLVTPYGGLVLDPFAGSGTTAEAAVREGMRAVLIEREPEYLADIERRCGLILAGPDERKYAILKAKGKVNEDPGPLFANDNSDVADAA